MDRTEETRVHQMELNASGSAKISDVLVVAWFERLAGCFRRSSPICFCDSESWIHHYKGFMRMSVERVDIEGAWNGDGFGLLVGWQRYQDF